MNLTIDQKMERVKEFLSENRVRYDENYESKKAGVLVPIYIWRYNIAVFKGSSQEMFKATRGIYAPLFVREEETMDFILEKMQNLLEKRKATLAWLLQREEQKKRNIEIAQQQREEARLRREAKKAAHEERMRLQAEEKRRREIEKVRGHRKRIVRYEKA